MGFDMQAMARIMRRLNYAIGRGRITADGKDDGNVQLHQVKFSDLETQNLVKRLSEFGFASLPPVGSDVVVLFLAGDRSNGCIIASGNQTLRLKNLNPGESALYDALGRSIWLTKDNGIVIEAANDKVTVNNATEVKVAASTSVTLDTPTVHVTGDIEVDGDVTAGTVSLKNHVHGGVQTGSGSTEPPTE